MQFESVGFDVVRAGLALDRLVGRHEMLRAVVRGDGRQQVLEVVPPVVVGLEDLSGVEGGVAAGRVAAVRDELSHEVRPADVWPLFEVRVQVLPGGVSRVHFSLDLLVADAGSVQIVLEEWALLYADPGVELAPLGCSFRDYVRALEGVESSEGFERARGLLVGAGGGVGCGAGVAVGGWFFWGGAVVCAAAVCVGSGSVGGVEGAGGVVWVDGFCGVGGGVCGGFGGVGEVAAVYVEFHGGGSVAFACGCESFGG
ncbi:hypothetical protein M2266_006476 [Streptomyces sp. SPB162]|nr:hypothetical protein [Streptomyces sp. SPB162]